MIFEFLFPIIGWLVLFVIFYVVYSNLVYKETVPHATVEGQAFYTVLATFFWVVVYMCLSSIWSILYSLIDLKYPDVVGAVSDYGTSGFSGSGVVYDAFAFPLATIVVSAITATILAFYLMSKFQKNKNLRPARLYYFLRSLVFIGGAILAFSGFVYVVYSWLYGNLPIAIFYKGIVAFVIVGATALYFYLVADGKNPKEIMISRVFSIVLVLTTFATLFASFNVIGTPAEARKYRLDSITLEAMRQIKSEIDNNDQNYGKRLNSLDEINNDYTKGFIRKMEATKNPIIYTTNILDKDNNNTNQYSLCANFLSDMPQTINWENRETTWDYKAGQSCFTFPHLPTYAHVNNQNNIEKPVFNQ